MTKLVSLKVQNYKAFDDTVFEPDSSGLTVVIGNNGSGKTSLWEVLSLLSRLANGWQIGWLTRQFGGRGRNFLGCLPWHRVDREMLFELHLKTDKPTRDGDIFYKVGWSANAETGEPQLTTEELTCNRVKLLRYDRTTGRYASPSPVHWHFLERNYPLALSSVGRQVLANTKYAAVKDAFDDVAEWGVYRFRVLDLGKSLSDLDIGSGPRESLTVVGDNLPVVLHAWKESPEHLWPGWVQVVLPNCRSLA
ncbi:MAG: AAA family ATPase [Acidobacteria bacterium]|nr:AAA family ATPase [Acidobacteriota bacterium]